MGLMGIYDPIKAQKAETRGVPIKMGLSVLERARPKAMLHNVF